MESVRVDFKTGCGCADSKAIVKPFHDKYVLGRILSAWLPVGGTFPDYIAACRKAYKGNSVREYIHCLKEGFWSGLFDYHSFVPDIVEINHSKPVRGGRPMIGHYRDGVEMKGGYPKEYREPEHPKCPEHWTLWFGVFQPQDGYRQGNVTTHKKLVAYTQLKRIGDTLWYNMIIGHGSYLKSGIMYLLHFGTVMNATDPQVDFWDGINGLIYANYDGDRGKVLWKKKLLFVPRYLDAVL